MEHVPQMSINSLIDKDVQPDTFTPPLHTLPGDVRLSLNQLLDYDLHRMKQVLEQLTL